MGKAGKVCYTSPMPPDTPEQKEGSKTEQKSMLDTIPVGEFLQKLPAALKGAATVERVIEPEDAKHYLVHIRQIHDLNRTNGELLKGLDNDEEQHRGLVQSQTDIHLILLHLRTLFGPLSVYKEGYIAGEEKSIAESNDSYRQLKKSMQKARQELTSRTTPSSAAVSLTIDKELLRESDLEGLAAGYLNRRGVVGIRGAESRALQDRLGVYFKAQREFLDIAQEYEEEDRKKGADRDQKKIDALLDKALEAGRKFQTVNKEAESVRMDGRENALLEITKNVNVAVTVFGAAHDWKDNIEEWNKKHPNDKYGLIVVTPGGTDAKLKNQKKE